MTHLVKAVQVLKQKSQENNILAETMKGYNRMCGKDYGKHHDAVLIHEDGSMTIERGIISPNPDEIQERKSEPIGNINDIEITSEVHKLIVDAEIVLYHNPNHYEILAEKVNSFDSVTVFVPLPAD